MAGGGPATGLPRQLGARAPMVAGTEYSAGNTSSLHSRVPGTCSVSSVSLWYSFQMFMLLPYLPTVCAFRAEGHSSRQTNTLSCVLLEQSLLPRSHW